MGRDETKQKQSTGNLQLVHRIASICMWSVATTLYAMRNGVGSLFCGGRVFRKSDGSVGSDRSVRSIRLMAEKERQHCDGHDRGDSSKQQWQLSKSRLT